MKKLFALLLMLLLLPSVVCAQHAGIFLYGEQHAVEAILQKELEVWQSYYQSGMRHLFVELPYYTAQYLNRWMQDDNDRILDTVYGEWQGTAMYSADVKAFYLSLKETCPETVFHGTDVGHQYNTTGERYLMELEALGLSETQEAQLTREVIAQGKHYYETGDDAYRENMMTENFARAFDSLGKPVMGIYGSAHTALYALNHTGTVYNMATQLLERYGDAVSSVDLSPYALNVEPIREERIAIHGKEYRALYYGAQDISAWAAPYMSRAFWQIEDAYADFSGMPTNGNVLPYDNYPMPVEAGDVFVIDYTLADGSVDRQYYRHDGGTWNGKATTVQFVIP